MKRIIPVSFFLVIFISNVYAQSGKNFTAMFYNVENLFDTIDHPDFADEEFTPSGSKEWDSARYGKKLKDIAMVIKSTPGGDIPAIMGFSEIENEWVLEDLIRILDDTDNLYPIVIEGEDPRGIDCGIIYNGDVFKYHSQALIPVEDQSGGGYKLRGILYVKGTGPDGKTLHLFVNHWKSRRGGVAETEYLRESTAVALRNFIDQLKEIEDDPRIIIMGDLNDEPTNNSIYSVLNAGNKRKNIAENDLYNLFYDIHNLDLGGSYNYRGTWQMYDHIIISYSLLNRDDLLSTTFDGGKILKEKWMLYHDERNRVYVPNRTYGGNNYYGGISDHFPIFVIFSY
ncbi:MAG: hypothetical protein K9J30_00195 [Bacteroidales bacterium]|nr:hypothetical protein [Bacteroidales bacterium]